ncbi:3-oxoadipate enol-lactonase [Prosthecomicrobium sp. N25]|uniref:3-oxoadipate enol-lactonase n=1 Tax=Prosthecomicrobium sp. N25 TaxID=3129254 RepID=UPI003078826A
MRMVRANGIEVHIALEGPEGGMPVVFANSLGTDLRVWDAVVPLLPKGLRMLRYDKRGHGLTGATREPYTIDLHVADLTGVLDALGIRGAVVVGLSIGGLIAQGLAAARPDLVRALVLMDTAHRIGTAETWNQRIEAIRAGGLDSIGDAVMERWFSAGYRAAYPEEVAGWRNMLVRTTVDGYLGSCAAIRDADLEREARSIMVPTLLLCGSADLSTPPDLVRGTAEIIPGARFEVIDGAGHLPCVEAPERTADLISGFVGALLQ